ncbi:MAG TPA: hypothetical protein VJ440_07890, partial [Candidatus Brocadiaceae bacterium]|nr:hypothetical protein [Candidatus Brocadiaceae bacterium]
SLIESNSRGSLTTRKSYGLKGYTALSRVVGDEWGLEATASSLPAKQSVFLITHRLRSGLRLLHPDGVPL